MQRWGERRMWRRTARWWMGREEDVEEDDPLVEYFSVGFVFLEELESVWRPRGHSVARLLRNSAGAVFFQFWLGEQLIADDVIQSVGCPRLVLRPGRGGRTIFDKMITVFTRYRPIVFELI